VLDPEGVSSYEEEYRITRPDGESRWVYDRAVPVRNDAGEIYRTVGIASDITERKEREQEYNRVLELLGHTEQIADVGGWEIQPETQDVFWSDHLFEMLGWEGDEEPSLEEALDVYVEADRPRVKNAFENALAEGESFAVEARFRRQGGDIRWFEIRGEPRIEDGEVVRLRGAVHDITDRKHRERTLREIYDITSNTDHSFENKVQALLELGREELGIEYGTLSQIRGDEYVFEFVDTDDDSIQPGDVVPLSATNCEIVASTEQTVVLGDIERDAPEETDRAGFTEWGISCYIGAPVFDEDGVYGTFCFYGTEPRENQFSEWEEALIDLMSS
jgi:PAS domain S-box-containing protein